MGYAFPSATSLLWDFGLSSVSVLYRARNPGHSNLISPRTGALVSRQVSLLVWVGVLVSLAAVIAYPRPLWGYSLAGFLVLRFTLSWGAEPTLLLLGSVNVRK